jgi:hypothetical protein
MQILRPAVLVLLAVALATSAVGCASAAINSARPPIPPGSVRLPDVRLPAGQWTASGTVLRSANSADEPAGTKLVRSWTFGKTCDPACRTIFLRQTLYGPSETIVTSRHGFYTAVFPPVTVPCAHYPGEDAGTAQSYDTYTLRWSPDRQQIIAIEHQHGVSQTCPDTQANRWVATRTEPNADNLAPGP